MKTAYRHLVNVFIALVCFNVLLGYIGFLVMTIEGQWNLYPDGVWAAQGAVGLAASGILLFAGRDDSRARNLGISLLLSSSSFTFRFIENAAGLFEGAVFTFLSFFDHLTLDAMLPYFFWQFAREFPKALVSKTVGRIGYFAQQASLVVGVGLIAANIALFFGSNISWLSAFDRFAMDSSFQTLVYGLALPVIFYIWIKTFSVRPEEKRRVFVFAFGILLGLIPTLAFILVYSLSPDFAAWSEQPETNRMLMPLLQGFIMAVPVVTTYSVVVERMLPIRLLLRQTARYAIGRGILVFGMAAPFLLLGWYMWTLRDQSLASMASSANVVYFLLAATLSGLVIFHRKEAYRYMDRLFFREHYNTDVILRQLSEKLYQYDSFAEQIDALLSDISQALHPESKYFFSIDKDGWCREVNDGIAAFPLDSDVGRFICSVNDCWSEDKNDDLVEDLGGAKAWLDLTGIKLIVVVRSKDSLLGVIAVGAKLSELPYSNEDRALLELVSRSCAASLVAHGLDIGRDLASAESLECLSCHTVYSQDIGRCPNCSGTQSRSCALPLLLNNKYLLQKVLGEGGMGIVYLSQDQSLNRPVVIKTLNTIGKEDLPVIQREAQTMGALSHPSIATIFGFDTYRKRPYLVCEYMRDGTLEDRLQAGRLQVDKVIDWGRQLIDALVYLHGRGVVHGDIKPANIGLNEGTPKLIDFGLARAEYFGRLPDDMAAGDIRKTTLAGTVAYMSPEVVQGARRNEHLDLWAFSLTLFEAMTGVNPFLADSVDASLVRIMSEQLDDQKEYGIECPDSLYRFLIDALSKDVQSRPQTAHEYRAGFIASIP